MPEGNDSLLERWTTAAQPTRRTLAEGATIAGIGALAGLFVSSAASQLVRGMLYGIAPVDGPTYAIAGMTIFLIALAACGLPAYRASRLDPATILRAD